MGGKYPTYAKPLLGENGGIVTILTLANIDKMTKEQLKVAIEGCFEHAREVAPVERLAIL